VAQSVAVTPGPYGCCAYVSTSRLNRRGSDGVLVVKLKEPAGLCRADGKRLDGMTLIHRKSLYMWNVTAICVIALSYWLIHSRSTQ